MSFDDLRAFLMELNRHELEEFEAATARTRSLVEFGAELVTAQTKVIAAGMGVRLG